MLYACPTRYREKEKRLKALEPQAFFAIMVGVAGFDEAVVQTPSSRSLATVHWTVAWEWVRIFESFLYGKRQELRTIPAFESSDQF